MAPPMDLPPLPVIEKPAIVRPATGLYVPRAPAIIRPRRQDLAMLAPSGLLAGAGGDTDPDFASVVLLIHGDADANDHSGSGHTVSLQGDAALSSAQSKFGTNSIYCDGTGDYISVSHATDFDFGTGDYTIEAWVYRNGAQGSNARLWGASDANDVTMYLSGGTTPNCFHDSTNVASSTVLTDGAWVHIAQVRESGTVALFQGGTREATGSDSATVNLAGLYFGNAGGAASGQYFKGYYNEIRVTAGVARYSGSSYTVPTAPFPDS